MGFAPYWTASSLLVDRILMDEEKHVCDEICEDAEELLDSFARGDDRWVLVYENPNSCAIRLDKPNQKE